MKLTRKQKQECVRVLREASYWIHRYPIGCCSAISYSGGQVVPEAIKCFSSIFHADSRKCSGDYWWPSSEQEVRIFALLLAAEIVRTDSLP